MESNFRKEQQEMLDASLSPAAKEGKDTCPLSSAQRSVLGV